MFKISYPLLNIIKQKSYCLICLIIMFNVFSSCIHQNKKMNFSWPVNKHTISRKFSHYHEGVDFPNKIGSAVLATYKGKVIYTGTQFSGYGKFIIIEHPHNWTSFYGHLHKILIKVGTLVKQNQKIGEIGSTGKSSGPHLHFELTKNAQVLNPLDYLPKK